ncbi:MAG: Gx transporter family protein [Clostridia bacterium]|nr:Gx transporter family protein [Clostridia bacterium]
MRSKSVRRLVFLAVCTSVAMVLSYMELLLPPIFAAVPGIKIGLANVAILFVLYRYGVWYAAAVSAVRVVLVAILFGNPMTFAYSVAGAILSLTVMALLRATGKFSSVGVSVVGGITHNLGQIGVAMVLLETMEIGYYMIALAVSGTVSGILVGLAGGYLVKRIPLGKF